MEVLEIKEKMAEETKTEEKIEISEATETPKASEIQTQKIKTFSVNQALDAFTYIMLNEDACRDWILKILHPDGAFCPNCKAEIKDPTGLRKFWSMQYTVCKNCGRRFLATKGTILHNSSLSMRQAFALAVLIALGLNNSQIAKIVDMHPDSIRLWRIKFNVV